MTTSLIITTYNRPDALKLVIKSALQQIHLPNEILIADDGSEEATQKVIQNLSSHSPIPLRHIWQEDRGFRAAMIRNRAIAEATGNYIIMIDGDMVLHPSFIQDHIQIAQPKRFIQGSRVLLTPKATEEAIYQEKLTFSPFSPGLKNRKNALHCPKISRYFAQPTSSMRGIKTCNFSLFPNDILLVKTID